jgi:hypothetical protein
MLPGGLGVADASIAGLLLTAVASPLMTRDVAVAASLLIRFATLWFGVALGATVVLLFWRRFSGFEAVGSGKVDVDDSATVAAPVALHDARDSRRRAS